MGALRQVKPEYRKIIEKMLINYPIYKQMQEIDYPPMIPLRGESVQGGIKEYTTEKYGIRRAERAKIIDQVEYALLFLTREERKLIEETYFRDQKSVDIIHERLAWARSTYYMKKGQIIRKIAVILEMV